MELVFRNGAFVPRLMLPLSFSFDHRAVDGATGARFIRRVAETLEQPSLLPLEGRAIYIRDLRPRATGTFDFIGGGAKGRET